LRTSLDTRCKPCAAFIDTFHGSNVLINKSFLVMKIRPTVKLRSGGYDYSDILKQLRPFGKTGVIERCKVVGRGFRAPNDVK
jgi:hypothetical protein